MKIRMKSLMVGPDGVRQPGEVFDEVEGIARELVKGGFAEEVVSDLTPQPPSRGGKGEIETGMITAPETAMKPAARAKPAKAKGKP